MKMSLAVISQASVTQCLDWARKAEEYGFDTLAFTDDMMYKPGWPIVMLAAKETERIELGITLSNPHTTHPAILASNAAILDEISDGRAFFGIGRGHLQVFKSMLNVAPTKPLAAVRESIEFAKRLWRNDPTTFNGEVFHGSEEAMLQWTPPRPDIPFLVGGWGPRIARIAGAHADRLLTYGAWHAGYGNELRVQIKAGAESVGRVGSACELEMEPVFTISDDGAEAKARAKFHLSGVIDILSPMSDFIVEPELLARINAEVASGNLNTAASLISDDVLDGFALYGTPHEVIDKIEAMEAEAAITRISFGMPFAQDEITQYIHLLGQTVVPHFLGKR
jgi:5,10-methylenetetrahydromethanopterin reductase